jgi:hypothetical protein
LGIPVLSLQEKAKKISSKTNSLFIEGSVYTH